MNAVRPQPSSLRPVSRRISNTSIQESLPPQDARIAMAARLPLRIRVIARVRKRVIDSQLDAAPDDLRFGHVDEWCDDAGLAAFDSAARAADDYVLKCLDELRPAVGIAAGIERVDADPDLRRVARFREP